MEQFIGCDAHKKFFVFVAVNEKGHAGEALRVTHDRQLVGWSMRWSGAGTTPGCAIRTKPSGGWG